MQQGVDDEIPGLRLSGGEHQNLVNASFQSAARYWKEIYERDDMHAQVYQRRQARVLRLIDDLGLPPYSHALEIGCGAGLTTVALAQRGYRVNAVDAVPAMLDLARQEAAKAGVEDRITTSLGDVHHLAFRDNSFSLVLAIGVASWLHSLDTAMQELSRVLRPQGYIVITAANRWCLHHILSPRSFPGLQPIRWKMRNVFEQVGLLKPGTEPRHRMYSVTEFDAFLSAARLEKMKGMTIGFEPFPFLNHLLPQSVGTKIDQAFQRLADRGLPLIRYAGVGYIALAKKCGRADGAQDAGDIA